MNHVPYDIAINLNLIGFSESCMKTANSNGVIMWRFICTSEENSDVSVEDIISQPLSEGFTGVPTFEQALDFFRINHNLHHSIDTTASQISFDWGFNYSIYDKENDAWYLSEPENCPVGEWKYKTHKEAKVGCIERMLEILDEKNI